MRLYQVQVTVSWGASPAEQLTPHDAAHGPAIGMSDRRDLRAAEHGFTLLELLVAITLLGLLMAALFGGLRLGARVWETADARLDASMRTQIVQDFVRQRLTETLPLETTAARTRRGGRLRIAFVGTIEAVRFASLLPENLGAGMYLMELALAAARRCRRHRRSRAPLAPVRAR